MTNEVLAIGLQGMQNDMACLDQVAMNLVNASTPGYKRGQVIAAPVGVSFAAHLGGGAQPISSGVALRAPVHLALDPRAGTLKATGESLDVAFVGFGFFVVLSPSGPAYTRQGNFHVDSRGRLVTAQGYPVAGVAGDVTIGTAKPVIAPNGEIASSQTPAAPLGRLKVVQFDSPAMLQHVGDGLMEQGPGMKVLADSEVRLRQGFLENSNVDSAAEMSQLVQTMRHFETMQKVVQSYDEMLGSAVRKLGDMS